MNKGTWILLGLFAVAPALGGSVYETHNKWPAGHIRESGDDSECNEHHHLMPDGDNDCDDKSVKGVPEPGTLGLLALGLGGLVLARKGRRP